MGGFPNFRIHTLDAWRVPLYNTMILISSGFTLTYSYHTLCLHHHDESIIGQVMAIGFHRMHVLIGTSFLIYNLYRTIEHEFAGKKSTGFEMGTWYWHFVDLIWIALFATIYATN